MHRNLLSAFGAVAVALVTCSGAQAQDRPEFPDVPRDHWSYAIEHKANILGLGLTPDLIKHWPHYRWSKAPKTRYEFATFTARALAEILPLSHETPGMTPARDLERLKLLDHLEALRMEYRDEIARIYGREPLSFSQWLNNLEQKVVPPPRMTTKLEFLKRPPSMENRTFLLPQANEAPAK